MPSRSGGHCLVCQCGIDVGFQLLVGGGAGDDCGDHAVFVQNQGVGPGGTAAQHIAVFILLTVPAEEEAGTGEGLLNVSRDVHAVFIVGVDGDDSDLIAVFVRNQREFIDKLSDAGSAPGAPEVDDGDFAASIVDADGAVAGRPVRRTVLLQLRG